MAKNLVISKRLSLVLEQLGSVTIFDKNIGITNPRNKEDGGKAPQVSP